MGLHAKTSQLLALGLVAFLGGPCRAAGEEMLSGVHFEGAARFGVAFPTYVAGPEFQLTLDVTAFPIWLDAGVRIGPLVFVGAYFSFAPTSATPAPYSYSRVSPCDVNCYARVYRFGIQVQLHPVRVPLGRGVALDPWVGVGTGYEVQQQRWDPDADCGGCVVPAHVGALQGPEWFNVQVGLALVFGRMSLGPYFAASYGAYQSDAGLAIAAQPHWWLNVGLRFTVTP
jgi:hypothetical protein